MCRRLRPLLQRLHLLPALNELLDHTRLQPGDTVVDVGALLTPAAAARVAPGGDVLAVDPSADRLEDLRHACTASNVFYLVGSAEVLPLVDAGVDAILAPLSATTPEAAAEFLRVLRSGGRVTVFESDQDRTVAALNLGEREVKQMFSDAGFVEVTALPVQGRLSGTARKP